MLAAESDWPIGRSRHWASGCFVIPVDLSGESVPFTSIPMPREVSFAKGKTLERHGGPTRATDG